MKLIVNTASTHKGGGVQVAHSFIEECRKYNNEYHVVLGNTLSGLINDSSFPNNFHFYRIGYRPATKVLSFSSHNRFLKELETSVKPDVVFTTSGPAYWRPGVHHLMGYNIPHYIYEDSPFFKRISLYKKLRWRARGKVIKYFFKNDADAYVVQTPDLNRRLQEWLQTEKVYTVSNTYSASYADPKSFPPKLPEKDREEFRFLTLSSWYPHKNIDIIIRVLNALDKDLKERVRFVLTLPEKQYLHTFPERSRRYIYNTGPVVPEEGPSLYRECDALFLPTLLECFSASYAESMKLDKPILTSDLSFAKSICRDAALYFDPLNPEEIVEKITTLIQSTELQEKMIKRGRRRVRDFPDAEQRAFEYLNLCKKLLDGKQNAK